MDIDLLTINFITDRASTKVHAAPGGGLLWDTSLVVVAIDSCRRVFIYMEFCLLIFVNLSLNETMLSSSIYIIHAPLLDHVV